MLFKEINSYRKRMEYIKNQEEGISQNETTIKKNKLFFENLNNFLDNINSLIFASDKLQFFLNAKTIENIKKNLDYCGKIMKNQDVNNTRPISQIDNTCNDIKQQWMTFIECYNDENVRRLTIYKAISNNPKEIDELIRLIKCIQQWPLNKEYYNIHIDAVSRAKNKLEGVHFDDEIERFLRKLEKKEATFFDLSDAIIKWIRSEELENKIAINFKNKWI